MGHIHYQSFRIVKRVFSPQLKSSILLISQSSTTIALNTSRAMLKKSLARQLRSVSDGPVRFLLSKNSTKYSRMSAELNSPHSTKLAHYYYREQLEQAGHYECQPQNAQQALIKRLESTQIEGRIVNLSNKTCTCREWQDYYIPCRHAIRAIQHLNKGDPKDLIHKRWSVEAYRDTYELSLHPVLLHELEPDGQTKPMPQQRGKKLGRPRVKRIKADTAHSRASKRARRQRHNVDPPTPEHQSTNQESSEHEVGNHSDNEDTDASSLPSLNSLLRRPQPRPPSPSPQPFPQPPLQPSPPTQPRRSNRHRQEPEPGPSQPPRKARRNAKSKYTKCKVCGSGQHQEGRLCPVPHCSHCFSQDHGSFDCKEPRAEGRPSLITGRS